MTSTRSLYQRFSQEEFEKFLEVQPDGKPLKRGGFYRILIPGTTELVYAKRIAVDLSLRIYSTIENGFVREKNSDAIRIVIFWKPTQDQMIDANINYPLLVGGESKVLRISTWRENLANRLNNYEQIIPPRCECGCPKVFRKPKKQKGQTWSPFWGCVLYKHCPAKR